VFHFAPQNLWYMVHQTGPPTYSTGTIPADPRSWSGPRTFFPQEPPIVTQNKGDGTWVGLRVICDSVNRHPRPTSTRPQATTSTRSSRSPPAPPAYFRSQTSTGLTGAWTP
jgi:hypothetical protein